jgi:hypothetical protein
MFLCLEPSGEKKLDLNILSRYPTTFMLCSNCGSGWLTEIHWLSESYQKVITNQDTGVVQRNFDFANILRTIHAYTRNRNLQFLDYGSGTGMLARIMRDRGFSYSSFDPYMESAFPNPLNRNWKTYQFEHVSMFEVFEHLEDPISTVQLLLRNTNRIIFSTELLDLPNVREDYWYLQLDSGQHIRFASLKGLSIFCSANGLFLHSNGRNLHIISKTKVNAWVRISIKFYKVSWIIGWLLQPWDRSKSLISSDNETSLSFRPELGD